MAKSVKMSDIAEKLNVSTVTVSKALSDQKGVSEEMRNKIKKLALDMGYQKPASKSEDRVRSFNVGVIVPEDYIEKHQTFYWEMYQEINMAAVKNNSFVMLEVLTAADEKAGHPAYCYQARPRQRAGGSGTKALWAGSTLYRPLRPLL